MEDTEANKVRKMKKRICLVLDCLCAHDFSDKTADLINLQHYVIKEKRLSEREAIIIFYDVVRVVEALHKVSQRRTLMHLAPANCSPLKGFLLCLSTLVFLQWRKLSFCRDFWLTEGEHDFVIVC